MSLNTLLIKGAINTSGEKPEVLKMEVLRQNLHQHDKDSSAFEIIFKAGDSQLLKMIFTELFGLNYLEDVICLQDGWSNDGILMAISVSLGFAKISELYVKNESVSSKVKFLFSCNEAFKEISLHEALLESGKVNLIKYTPAEILVVHESRGFSARNEGSLLDSALDQGVDLKYMCKAGICMKCRKKILSGASKEISPQAESSMVKDFHLLTCNSHALTSLVIG